MRLEKHEDPDKIGVSIFKPMVLETYLELSNGTGTTWKLCVCSFPFYKRFSLFWSLNTRFFGNCVRLHSKKSTKHNILSHDSLRGRVGYAIYADLNVR